MTTKVVRVIFSDEALRGTGEPDNIFRRVPKLFTLDGQLICLYDVGRRSDEDAEEWVDYRALTSLERES